MKYERMLTEFTEAEKLSDFYMWSGSDSSTEISLFEHGLLWNDNEDGTYDFIYGVCADRTGTYTHFYRINSQAAVSFTLKEYDWIEENDVSGDTWELLLESEGTPEFMAELLNHFQKADVFGCAYCEPFRILHYDLEEAVQVICEQLDREEV